jgi:hypothetical protein
MRMRQLGHGQSIMFFAPLDVDRRIKSIRTGPEGLHVSAANILKWVMLETIASIEHYIPHWAQQGVNYQNRLKGWNRFERTPLPDGKSFGILQSSWVEKEARTLEEMYHPSITSGTRASHPAFGVAEMKARLDRLGVCSVIETSMDEEQEREVAHEIERESQVSAINLQ